MNIQGTEQVLDKTSQDKSKYSKVFFYMWFIFDQTES